MQFSVGNFEGPLDLLLALVRREEMDIMQIDLHKITNQYLSILNTGNFNLEEGGEFIHIASVLLYIKSKSLLPQIEMAETEEEEIYSKESLIQALNQHSEFLKAAEQLNQREILNRDIWSCSGLSFEGEEAQEIKTDNIFSLMKVCREVLKRAYTYPMKVIFPSTIEWIQRIQKHFVKGHQFSFSKLIQKGREPVVHQVLLSFLSLLELSKIGAVSLIQKGKDIRVFARKDIDAEIIRLLRGDLRKTGDFV